MIERTTLTVSALSRSAALSRFAGQEGQINLHKLLDAAIFAAICTSAAESSADVSWAELGPVRAELQALGVASVLLRALEQAEAAILAGAVPLIETAPDVYVCRVCGHTALAAPPERCPTCGAWSGTFRGAA
jgi:hypothetical protein